MLCSIAQLNAQSLTLNTITFDSETVSKSADNKVIYQLNSSIFEQNLVNEGSTIQVSLSSGINELEVTRVTEFIPGIKSYRAISTDGQIFSFTYQNGAINGVYHESLTNTKLFKVNRASNESYISDSEHESHNCSLVDVQNISNNLPVKAKNSSINDLDEITKLPGNDINEQSTIDLMISYTSAAKEWASSEESDFDDIDGVLAQAMNLVQTVFDNSALPITFRLVHTHEVDYDESNAELDANGHNNENILFDFVGDEVWHPLKSGDTAMNEIHELRDQYGADIMALVVEDMIGSGGTAYAGTGLYGIERGAFNNNIVKQITDDSYTLVHEIGHNLGIQHSRTQNIFPASAYGGTFPEAVGYQDPQNGFTTMMGYTQEDISIILPYFSDPNLSFEGAALGVDDAELPANAVKTIKRIKHLVASYRPTVIAPPVPVISTAPITVDLGSNETIEVPFNIQNTGESDLTYSIDFDLVEEDIVAKNSSISSSVLNYVGGDTLLYTGFESEEDFPISTFTTRYEWQAGKDLTITNESPSSGTQHLRYINDESDFVNKIYTPNMGQLEFGTYKIGFSLRIPDVPDNQFTRYEVNIIDGQRPGSLLTLIDRKVASIAIRLGDVEILGQNFNGKIYIPTSSDITYGEYHYFEIVIDSEEQRLKYYMNGEPLISLFTMEPAEYDLVDGELTPSSVQVSKSDNVAGAYIDFDDVSIIKFNSPYRWLSVEDNHKTIKPGESKAAQLSFNSGDLETGVYTAQMRVSTNNDGENSFEVPVTLNITSTVSNEDNQVAETFELDQNYPNPFNPSTNISFTLPDVSEVNLQVYDMLGRSVATLVDGRLNAGKHEISFDASALASGMYVYTIQAGNYTSTKRMLLLK